MTADTTDRIAELRARAAQYREWQAEALCIPSLSSAATAGYWADAAFEAELEATLLEGVEPVDQIAA